MQRSDLQSSLGFRQLEEAAVDAESTVGGGGGRESEREEERRGLVRLHRWTAVAAGNAVCNTSSSNGGF